MSDREQAAAIRLLMAARELLSDTLASDAERQRMAQQIAGFINHEPIDREHPAWAVGKKKAPTA